MAISRDTGASFPIIAGTITGPVATVDTATFNASSATTLIVVRVALGNFQGTDWGTPTCVWIGGTPANASAFTPREVSNYGSAGSYRTAIFTATVTGVLTGVSVRAGGTNSIADANNPAVSVAVDALTGASTTMGTSASEPHDGVSADHAVALTGVAAGSWVFVSASGEDAAAFTPVSGTTEDDERHNSGADAGVVIGVNTAGNSPTSVGWSTTTTWGTTSALEILAAAVPAITTVSGTPLTGTSTVGSTATITIPASTWLTNDVIVALVTTNNNTVDVNTISGGGLTWARRANNTPSGAGYVGIYTAVAASNQAASGQVITLTDDDGSNGGRSLTVYVLRDADPSQSFNLVTVPAVGTATWTISLTGQSTSWYGVVAHSNAASTMTPNGATTEDADNSLGGSTGNFQGHNASSGTTQTLGGTFSAGTAVWRAMIEILAAQSAGIQMLGWGW